MDTVVILDGFEFKIPTAFWISGHPYAWEVLFLSCLKLLGLIRAHQDPCGAVTWVHFLPHNPSYGHHQDHQSHYNCRDSKSSHWVTGSNDDGSWRLLYSVAYNRQTEVRLWASPFWTVLCISTRWSKVWPKDCLQCGNHKQRNTNKSRTLQYGR